MNSHMIRTMDIRVKYPEYYPAGPNGKFVGSCKECFVKDPSNCIGYPQILLDVPNDITRRKINWHCTKSLLDYKDIAIFINSLTGYQAAHEVTLVVIGWNVTGDASNAMTVLRTELQRRSTRTVTLLESKHQTMTYYYTGRVVPVEIPTATNVFIVNGLNFPSNKVVANVLIVGVPDRQYPSAPNYTGVDFMKEFFCMMDILDQRRQDNTRSTVEVLYSKNCNQHGGERSILKQIETNDNNFQAKMDFGLKKTVLKVREKGELRLDQDEDSHDKKMQKLDKRKAGQIKATSELETLVRQRDDSFAKIKSLETELQDTKNSAMWVESDLRSEIKVLTNEMRQANLENMHFRNQIDALKKKINELEVENAELEMKWRKR